MGSMKKDRTYNTLVRDHVPEILERQGMKPLIRHLEDQEYVYALHEKLKEEMREYMAGRNIEELADIVEVINAILNARGITMEELDHLRKLKAQTNGTFRDRVFLERVLTPEEAEMLKKAEDDPVFHVQL